MQENEQKNGRRGRRTYDEAFKREAMNQDPTTDERSGDRGLKCRRCECRQFRVIYTRRAIGGKLVRRLECRHCGTRMTTWERTIGGG